MSTVELLHLYNIGQSWVLDEKGGLGKNFLHLKLDILFMGCCFTLFFILSFIWSRV